MLVRRDKNALTLGKKKMTGEINCSTSKQIDLIKLKELSKKLKITINDIILSAISTTIQEYFKLSGDKLGSKPDGKAFINILIPANIRYGMYPTAEEVKLENMFAALPLQIPLFSNMKNSYKQIVNMTKDLKGKYPYIVASYVLSYWSSLLSPRFLPRLVLHESSLRFTLAFSNTPGPVKPFPVST